VTYTREKVNILVVKIRHDRGFLVYLTYLFKGHILNRFKLSSFYILSLIMTALDPSYCNSIISDLEFGCTDRM